MTETACIYGKAVMARATVRGDQQKVVDLNEIATNLEPGPEGIWVSRSRSPISYPEAGNEMCLGLEAASFWFGHRNQCIQAVVNRFPPQGVLFDVGGGNGYVAAGLNQAGVPVALLEPGWAGAQNARRRGVETVICSTLEDAGFLDGALPAAGLFDVLEHIADEGNFLASLHQRMAPGGKLYLTVPAYPALWSADDDYAGHHRRYTLSSLRRSLESAGFRVIFSSYIFWMLPLPILLFRSLPSRLGWRKQAAWDRYFQEHRSQPGPVGWLLGQLLKWELKRVRNGQRVWMGGSCLAVAEKDRS